MKVLVVDDDVVSRMVLMHLIDSAGGVEVAEAEDGADAWDQLAGGLRPDLCFCDLRMPRLSGMELLRRVKADPLFNAIDFVMVSSANETDTVEQALGLGAAGYIIKPFDAAQVRLYLSRFGGKGLAADAETPLATTQRLGINGERLLAYLSGFQAQVSAFDAELPALLALGDEAARLRIERLHTGCQTLGLHGAAAQLRGVPASKLEASALSGVLGQVTQAVARQAEVARRQYAPD